MGHPRKEGFVRRRGKCDLAVEHRLEELDVSAVRSRRSSRRRSRDLRYRRRRSRPAVRRRAPAPRSRTRDRCRQPTREPCDPVRENLVIAFCTARARRVPRPWSRGWPRGCRLGRRDRSVRVPQAHRAGPRKPRPGGRHRSPCRSTRESGVTPVTRDAPPGPTLKPVITSSKTSSAPASSHARRSPSKNPGSGATSPMLAATGSTMTQATALVQLRQDGCTARRPCRRPHLSALRPNPGDRASRPRSHLRRGVDPSARDNSRRTSRPGPGR